MMSIKEEAQKQREGVVPFSAKSMMMMMMMMMILLVVLGLSVSVTHAAERKNHHHRHRADPFARYDDDDDDDDDGRRGINVGEDPNVHQFKKGTDEHVEVLTAENFKKFTTGSEHVLVTFCALGWPPKSF